MSAQSRDAGTGAARLLAEAAAAARAVPERLTATIQALFVSEPWQPSDRQRTIVARLLDRLITDIEHDLRAEIAAAAAPDAAIGSETVAIAKPMLRRASMLADADLFRLLLARAEEHRLVEAMRRRATADPAAPISGAPIDAADPEAARAEMALVIAESRRFDRVDEPELTRDDVPAELLERLVWRIAAALRHHLLDGGAFDPAAVDTAISDAVGALLAGHDEGRTLDAAAYRLARLLNGHGGIDDAQLRQSLDRGRFALFAALLAARAGMEPGVVIGMAIDPSGARLAVLLRALGVDRATAVSVLLDIAQLDDDALARLVDDYDALTVAAAIDALRPWRLTESYRRAIADFGTGLALAEAGGR